LELRMALARCPSTTRDALLQHISRQTFSAYRGFQTIL
jgi:hypothetical protein